MDLRKLRVIGFMLLFLIAGPILAFKGAREILQCTSASGWPTAAGVVNASNVEMHQSKSISCKSPTYDVIIRYTYTVNDRPHFGSRLSFNTGSRSSEDDAHAAVQRYPAGRAIQVHYNPESPDESVLETAVSGWSWLLVGIGVGLFIVGILIALGMRRRADDPDRDADAPALGTT